MISNLEEFPIKQNAGIFHRIRKPKHPKTNDEALILRRVQLTGRPPPPPKNDQFSMISCFSEKSKARNAGVFTGFRDAQTSKRPVRHQASVPTAADGIVTQNALQRSNPSRNVPVPDTCPHGLIGTECRPMEKSPPPACLFASDRIFRQGLSRTTGPDTPPRVVFRKNLFGEFEKPPKSLPFRPIDPRGGALIPAPGTSARSIFERIFAKGGPK